MTQPRDDDACGTTTPRLSRYMDGELEWAAGRSLRSHLRACGSCAALASDLRALRAAAAALPILTPERDLWPGISARLERRSEGRAVAARPVRGPRWVGARRVSTPHWLAAAAAALLMLGVGASSVLDVGTYGRRATRVPAAGGDPRPREMASAHTVPIPTPMPGGRAVLAVTPAIGRRRPAPTVTRRGTVRNAAEHRDAFDVEIRRLHVAGRRALRSVDHDLDRRTAAALAQDLAALDVAVAETHTAFVRHARHGSEAALAGRQLHHLLDQQMELVETLESLDVNRSDR